MPQLTVDHDTEIYYSDHGSGPPVLMLHGWACDSDDWIWLASDFAAIDNAVVVGHSLGGLVASALAVEYPEMVAALVLIDPAYGYTDETVAPIIAALRGDPVEAARGLFARMYVGTSPSWQRLWHERRLGTTRIDLITEAFCAGFEGPDGVGHRSLAGPYHSGRQCPVLSVHSGASAALLADWERSLPHGPDDQIIEWNDCGHFLHQEKPDAFAALARSWLAALG